MLCDAFTSADYDLASFHPFCCCASSSHFSPYPDCDCDYDYGSSFDFLGRVSSQNYRRVAVVTRFLRH